ncbi:adenylosuccinate lyase [Methylacidiphilum kamchatkense Kam1]|uniref:Adenylosuccinate lyase n=1 Tax=Methylacidiphilum kamchatkense Kam1 TaxID=1202785 RepID=A0A0C1UMS1_9BACT|nr:adenylosuccinate lyase [Methylacidiphilum kamchatkense]KIE57874.1 adenylosuccinate lyase [Methylacidiphilum kamchatkense Kam1]QDQ41370.1 adenylosuccinate lyase [Methylacidiphilum kamchatkense Kam1]
MIDRYSREPMLQIWSEQKRVDSWIKIEFLVLETLVELGYLPREETKDIQKNISIGLEEIKKREAITQHEILAFLEPLAEQIGPAGRYLHFGLTSSDILDTTFALQLKEAAELLLSDIDILLKVIEEKAIQYAFVPMIGRTHGVFAEPTTYGLKLLQMLEEFKRARSRLLQAKEEISYGMISGAVGTYAHLDPEVEAIVLKKLGLKVEPISSQVIPRDRHAFFLNCIALIGSSVERWATEFRHLQRSEVLEVEEPFKPKQKGSSAMPHKKNPILCERLCGLARLLRGYALSAMENISLWHERDISHSSVERVAFPDATILLDYMLALLSDVLKGQTVYPERMKENILASRELFASEGLMLALVQKGISRKEAYEAVQQVAMSCWQGDLPLSVYAKSHPFISTLLEPKEINSLCSLDFYLKNVPTLFHRCGVKIEDQPVTSHEHD